MKLSPHPVSGCAISRESGSAAHDALLAFLGESEAGGALLIDESGAVLYQAGGEPGAAAAEFGALAAGALAATRAMAGRLGEGAFEGFHFQGGRRQVFLRPVGARFFLCAVYGERTNLGIVRACGRRFADVVGGLDIAAPSPGPLESACFMDDFRPPEGIAAFPPLSFESASRGE